VSPLPDIELAGSLEPPLTVATALAAGLNLADPVTAYRYGAQVNVAIVRLESEILQCALGAVPPALTFDEVAQRFHFRADAKAAYRLLDLDANGMVSRDEFANSLLLMHQAWASTKTALASYSGIGGAIRILANAVYWVLQVIVVLAIYDVNLNNVLVPMTTLVIAFGFAVGPTIQRIIDSLLLILIVAPFDVGDRVTVATVAGGAVVTVAKIYLMATEFVDASNRRVIARNADLVGQTIVNLRRSGEANITLKWSVDAAVSTAQLRALRDAVVGYIQTNAVCWKPVLTFTLNALDGNKMELVLSVGGTVRGCVCAFARCWGSGDPIPNAAGRQLRASRGCTRPPSPASSRASL